MARIGIPVTLILVALASGCTTTTRVARPADLEAFQRMVVEHGEGKLVTETGTGGRGYEVRSHVRGAMDGLGVGLASGAVLGAAAGLVSGDDPPCGELCFPMKASEKAIVGGVLVGLTGGLTGLLVGALVGHKDRFLF